MTRLVVNWEGTIYQGNISKKEFVMKKLSVLMMVAALMLLTGCENKKLIRCQEQIQDMQIQFAKMV